VPPLSCEDAVLTMKEDDSPWFWDGKYFDRYEDIDPYDFQKTILEFLPESVFHIGQSYEKKVADTYCCKRCGGTAPISPPLSA
jgi:hypothetical protein